MMAYPAKRDGNFPGHSYLDGMPVKISEKFRPPRKITLPLSYQHHCPVELLNEEYDFSLEKNVLESSATRRRRREEAENLKAEQLASTIEEFTRSGGEEEAEVKVERTEAVVVTSSSLMGQAILQPVPVSSGKPDVTMRCQLNLEDFEAESSPFDSMALKTLDDMEELKTVLANDHSSSAASSWSHFSLNLQGPAVDAQPDSAASTPLRGSHSTPDLLKEIASSLKGPADPPKESRRPSSGLSQTSRECVVMSAERDLHPEFQKLVEHIVEMGFRSAQVVQAVQHFGTDDKKLNWITDEVIEHLCVVQTMVDLGYDPKDAQTALILHKHNESQTKEYLRLLVHFRDLGFDDLSIKNALQRFNNDRDKALDFLVS